MFHLKFLLFSTTALTLLCLFIVFDLNTWFVLKLRYPIFLPLPLEIRRLLYKPGWPRTHQGQPASACWGLGLKVYTMPSHTITFNHHVAFNLLMKLVAFWHKIALYSYTPHNSTLLHWNQPAVLAHLIRVVYTVTGNQIPSDPSQKN